MSDNKFHIPARVVVSNSEKWGLRAVLEVQVPGTDLWLPAKPVAFQPEGGSLLSYIEVAGQSLKRFAASIPAPPASDHRVDTATADEEGII